MEAELLKKYTPDDFSVDETGTFVLAKDLLEINSEDDSSSSSEDVFCEDLVPLEYALVKIQDRIPADCKKWTRLFVENNKNTYVTVFGELTETNFSSIWKAENACGEITYIYICVWGCDFHGGNNFCIDADKDLKVLIVRQNTPQDLSDMFREDVHNINETENLEVKGQLWELNKEKYHYL